MVNAALPSRTRDMRLGSTGRHAAYRATCIWIPVGRAETGTCRDEHDVRSIGHTRRQRFDLRRMLNDAHKPLRHGLRGPAKIPIDLRLKPQLKQKPGDRLANARDKTSIYSTAKDNQMSDKEREKYGKEVKER